MGLSPRLKFVIGGTLTILSWDNPVTAYFRKNRKLRHSFGKPSRSDFVQFEVGGESMKDVIKNWKGILLCFAIAVPSWFLGKQFEIIGGAVIAIIAGMIITLFWKEKGVFEGGIKFTSKKILQWAVILLGFGLNLGVVYQTGIQSLPIIVCTITISILIAFVLHILF